jgi:5'-nucleotidase
MRRMRILVTNDDGIHAPGLAVCEEIARALSDDVLVVAPEIDNSGVSHSLSLSDPLRLREIDANRFALKGTPTDCVIMAVRHIATDRKPDLVLSGVNRGSNVADDVTYSGTIAGAMEGTVLGIPSFALSQSYGPGRREKPYWETARKHAPDLVRRIIEAGVPKDVLVNINFPDCQPGEIRGIAVTSQGQRDEQMLNIDARVDGRGIPYYWLAFARKAGPQPRTNTDLWAMADKRISVTPLRLDLTDEPFMTRLAEVLG